MSIDNDDMTQVVEEFLEHCGLNKSEYRVGSYRELHHDADILRHGQHFCTLQALDEDTPPCLEHPVHRSFNSKSREHLARSFIVHLIGWELPELGRGYQSRQPDRNMYCQWVAGDMPSGVYADYLEDVIDTVEKKTICQEVINVLRYYHECQRC